MNKIKQVKLKNFTLNAMPNQINQKIPIFGKWFLSRTGEKLSTERMF